MFAVSGKKIDKYFIAGIFLAKGVSFFSLRKERRKSVF